MNSAVVTEQAHVTVFPRSVSSLDRALAFPPSSEVKRDSGNIYFKVLQRIDGIHISNFKTAVLVHQCEGSSCRRGTPRAVTSTATTAAVNAESGALALYEVLQIQK